MTNPFVWAWGVTKDILGSFFGLPPAVYVWVSFLLLVNTASVYFAVAPDGGHPIGFWTALAMAGVALANGSLLVFYRGCSRSLAIPHLVFWVPLEVWLLYVYSVGEVKFDDEPEVFIYGILVLLVNGISIAFDINDSRRFLAGEREVLGK